MTTRTRRILLSLLIVTMLAMLLTFAFRPDLADDPAPPSTVEGMAVWLTQHPADWHTASVLTDRALDASAPRRFELWRASFALARGLAPLRPNPSAAFVRSGLFHWYELGAADRQAVLEVAAPMLRDPRVFGAMAGPLWQLTHDLAYLRRSAPDTLGALDQLRQLALTHGRFDDYRSLREAMRRKRLTMFASRRTTATIAELLDLLPQQLEAADEPLVRGILEELDRRSADTAAVGGRGELLAQFAIDHDVAPLGGLEPFLEAPGHVRAVTRARLALRMNQPDIAAKIELTSGVTGAPEWVPYLLERARYEAARGQLAAARLQLAEAELAGPRPETLAVALELATLGGDAKTASRLRQELASSPAKWENACSPNELCTSVFTTMWTDHVRVRLAVVQTDEIPPYVELYVDDALRAEGAVRNEGTFDIPAGLGTHRVEVRLVNRMTRNGVSRRLRVV